MRLIFSDGTRIFQAAKANVENGLANLKRWWSKKYKLPPNHLLFRDQTFPELNQEMMEDLLLRRKEVVIELEEDDDKPKSRREVLLEQLRILNNAIGDGEDIKVTQDDLADYWDEQLAKGEMPDLTMTVDDLKRIREAEDNHA